MMESKKCRKWLAFSLAFLMVCSVAFTGCNFGNDGSQDDTTQTQPTEYVIQYTDDAGAHTIRVKDGEPFALESVPARTGYDFMGLYDAKVGGTQYVDETGQSLSSYTDKKNMVLFPQWKAKEYTLWLDFAGAEITGPRNYTVTYGQTLPELPKSVYLENQSFKGWFTEEDCGGTQVADNAGLILNKAIVNENNFDLSDPDGFIYLYAGFAMQTHTVTFYFGRGMQSETVEVEHGTPISEVVPDTRNEDGFAVLSWSERESGGQVFDGDITFDMVLYAVEWAPVIELDTGGGEKVAPVVEKAGNMVALPTPVRDNYTFKGWVDENGNVYEVIEMPATSMRLIAQWWAQISFDSRGGGEFDIISQEDGSAITLPHAEKSGYMFAGWYNENGEKVELSVMPGLSMALNAMYYEVRTEKLVVLEGTSSIIEVKEHYSFNTTFTLKAKTRKLDFAEAIENDWSGVRQLKMRFSVKIRDAIQGGFKNGTFKEAYFNFYSINNTSSANLIGSYTYQNPESELKEWKQLTFEVDMPITDGAAYFEFSAKCTSNFGAWGGYYGARICDMWAEADIPDTTKLV